MSATAESVLDALTRQRDALRQAAATASKIRTPQPAPHVGAVERPVHLAERRRDGTPAPAPWGNPPPFVGTASSPGEAASLARSAGFGFVHEVRLVNGAYLVFGGDAPAPHTAPQRSGICSCHSTARQWCPSERSA